MSGENIIAVSYVIDPDFDEKFSCKEPVVGLPSVDDSFD